jgi:SecD/SecF fusion protein
LRKIINTFMPFCMVILLLATLILSTMPQILRHINLGLDLKGGFEILYQVEPIDANQKVTRELLQTTEKMVEKRVNMNNVSEPEITIEGTDRIRVKIAGITDQNKLREQIGQPAYLSFINESGQVVLDGRDLSPNGASIGYDQLNRPEVIVKFQDSVKLKNVTKENLGKPLSIYLDDKLVSTPIVESVVTDGTSSIRNQTFDSATEMTNLLNAGSLPAKLIEKQVTSVSASLGEQALQKTLMAGYISSAFILIFMLIFYRLPGLIANITLIGFAYICLVFLDWMNVTLTLSGIAGFVLAIGMAVDANIITSERIKEELKEGKGIRSAFISGSRSSFATILDAHVTTLIAALVLMLIGTNSVKGFSIVMILTILISLLTNVFGSRILLWLLLKDNVIKSTSWFGVNINRTKENPIKPKLNIVKKRNRYFSFSAIILILGLIVVLSRGLNLGVDFQSGTRLDLNIGSKFEATDITKIIREQIPSVGMKPVVKYGENGFSATTSFSKPISANQLNLVEEKLKEMYGNQVSKQESTVDPMIANEMVKTACTAIIIASGGIILYTAIRFQFSFGIACIIALIHDILIPIAIFSIFGVEIDLTFIAAILTIVGYSLNDTIVIFDRIRMNMKKAKIKSLQDLENLVNMSLWQTMKRSIYTVLTVFLAVVCLLILGGESIHIFSLALLFGLVSGAYSSIFIAAQLWLMIYKRKFK